MRKTAKFISFLILPALFASPAWSMGRQPEQKDWRTEGVMLKLKDAYDLALKQSETVKIQQQEIKRTNAEFFQAVGESVGDVNYKVTDFLQQAQGSGDAGGGSSVGGTLTSEERRERKFVINQPLFQGFKSVGAIAGAGSLRKQRKEDILRAKEILFLDVASVFYNLLRLEKDFRTTEGIRDIYAERVKDLREREKIGRSRASEISSAVSGMRKIEAELARAEGAVKIAKEQMAFLTGVPAELIHVQDEKVSTVETQAPDITAAVESRASVESARQTMKTAWRKVIVAQSDFWPQIDLDINQYDRREGFQSGIDWDALFTIDIPLFTGGATYGVFREAVVDWQQAKLNYALVKRQAELEIKADYENWLTSIKENEAMRKAEKAAQENYRLQKEDYEKNLVNNLDVIASMQAFFEISKQTSRAYFDMKQNYWKLQTSLGQVAEIHSKL